MTGVTTHVLDTSRGKPAEGIRVQLQRNVAVSEDGQYDADGPVDYEWENVGETTTNSDGRGSSPLILPTAGSIPIDF